ncbi:MAG TPA: alginate lyase family protein [Gemmatimonadales bacterium]
MRGWEFAEKAWSLIRSVVDGLVTAPAYRTLRSRGAWLAADPAPAPEWRLPAGAADVALLREADKVISTRPWDFFGLDPAVEAPIDWHRDPYSGRQAPRRHPLRINHRDPAVVRSIKCIWEKNRHQHLTRAALAYRVTGDERYAEAVTSQLLDWCENNPPFVGVNWSQGLESGIRLIAWAWCERLLRSSTAYTQAFGPQSPLWRAAYLQMRQIRWHASTGSSANNHLLGELAGLVAAAEAFPHLRNAAAWGRWAAQAFNREFPRQFDRGGLNREAAFAYHVFSAVFGLHTWIAVGGTGDLLDGQFETALASAIRVVGELRSPAGRSPRYGDDDEGVAFLLSARSVHPEDILLAAGQRWWNLSFGFDPRAEAVVELLSGGKLPRVGGAALGAFDPTAVSHVPLRMHSGDREVLVLFDTGPHGFPQTGAHGHADALAFTLSVGEADLVVDPGTYCYHEHPTARNQFRDSRAHNVLIVNGEPQSEIIGLFQWGRRANATLRSWEATTDQVTASAEHDGYAHLGARHERVLRLQPEALLVTDRISVPSGTTWSVEGYLHFHPDAKVERAGPLTFRVRVGEQKADLELEGWAEACVVRGEPVGVYSRRYLQRESSPALVATAPVAGHGTFSTQIRWVT